MKTLLLYGDISRLKVAVVFLVDVAPFDGLLPHGLLHGPVGAFLESQNSLRGRKLKRKLYAELNKKVIV